VMTPVDTGVDVRRAMDVMERRINGWKVDLPFYTPDPLAPTPETPDSANVSKSNSMPADSNAFHRDSTKTIPDNRPVVKKATLRFPQDTLPNPPAGELVAPPKSASSHDSDREPAPVLGTVPPRIQ